MKILSEIEAAGLPSLVSDLIQKMKRDRLGGEAVVLEYDLKEIKVLQLDFEAQRRQNRWEYQDQSQLDKAQMMHAIGIALKNSQRTNCSWFKEAAQKIYQDATEFDQNSTKTLMTTKGKTFIIIVYNGQWINGEIKKNDRIIRDDSDGTVGEAGEDVLF